MRKIVLFLLCALFSTPVLSASLINDTETERVLTKLVLPLARAANIPDNRLKIHIVNDDDFNAFVMGGDDVYVYTGLLRQIKSPDALQAVVAHELGHTLGGHMAQMSERMNAEMKRTMLIQALGVGLMVAGGNPSLGAGVMAGATGVAQQSMLAFTRDEERIADNLGVDLMVSAKQNPHGFVTVLEQMHELTGAIESKINPNRINHPLTTERLNNVRARIADVAPDYKPNKSVEKSRHAEYELVRAKLVGYLDAPSRVRELYPSSDMSDSALYARAIANMRGGNLDGARIGTRTLIARNPDNPYFYELLGDIEYQFGHYDDSVDAYERALELAGDAPQIQTALALVLSERARPDDKLRAIEMAKRSLLSEPAPLTYWVLARAYGDSDSGRHDWAMAEYYNMTGDTKNVKKYAKRAQKKLKKSDSEYIKAGDLLK
ncbi:MAG: M48 family metalloprotease [Alphaproteobacteria bacterium]|nr:M48 family metalloprotease [Alphaproteobacteria bacterium]